MTLEDVRLRTLKRLCIIIIDVLNLRICYHRWSYRIILVRDGYERLFAAAPTTRQNLQGMSDGKRRHETVVRCLSRRNARIVCFGTGEVTFDLSLLVSTDVTLIYRLAL